MQTGYFYKTQNNPNVISISAGQPKYISDLKIFDLLAPKWKLLSDFRKNVISETDYVIAYTQFLNKLNPQKTWDLLHDLAADPIICCHCSTKHFCHRHLVASWFEQKLNVIIPEHSVGIITRLSGNIAASAPSQLNLL